MKKIVALLLVAIVSLTIVCAAIAEEAQYDQTRRFLTVLDAKSIPYSLLGLNDEGDERVVIETQGNAGNNYDIFIYFPEGGDNVQFYAWNLITFDQKDAADVLYAVNDVNARRLYTSTFADFEDYSVNVSMTAMTDTDASGELYWNMIMHLVDVVDDAYDCVAAYAK